jgi:DnaA family protein
MSRAQLPLALKAPRRPRFGNFVQGANGAVVATLSQGAEAGTWYLLAGPSGSGRTHLLSAFFADRCRRGDESHFISLGNPRQRALLDHAAGDWVVLDDVDLLAGDKEGERALFNALNRWRSEHTGVLMAAAGREGFALPDLRSRIGQATRLTLKPLEESELAELIRALADEHEVVLGRGVVDYMLRRAPRNAGRLSELVEAGARRALTERRTLSVPLVRDLLFDRDGQR